MFLHSSNRHFYSGLWIPIRNLRRKPRMLNQLHQVRIWSATSLPMHQGLGLRREDPRMQLAWSLGGEMQPRSCRWLQMPSQGWSTFNRRSLLAIPTIPQPKRSSQSLPLQRRSPSIDCMRWRKILRSKHFDLRRRRWRVIHQNRTPPFICKLFLQSLPPPSYRQWFHFLSFSNFPCTTLHFEIHFPEEFSWIKKNVFEILKTFMSSRFFSKFL